MTGKRKRRTGGERPGIHPRNKYSDTPPDFGSLASLYPSFQAYVFYSRDGKPRIDWTDFNATRELTRVLLLHDHGINWWVPDGQLCPTVPNRSNYIHWVEDLLASDVTPSDKAGIDAIKGFDIGTGANCIYPLLGASLLGWNFVGSDITDVAIEWANRNVNNNPHISELIEIRRVYWDLQNSVQNDGEVVAGSSNDATHDSGLVPLIEHKNYNGPPILFGVVKDDEKFDFCMCNPPFFESMEEAGLNPKTSCGGTQEEMVCFGGEYAFITRIIEDSVKLKNSFRWYTSMVGRKVNLNNLVKDLWKVRATVVKTTEFVQGKTSRWGIAWSFLPVSTKMKPSGVVENNSSSFLLEGVLRQYSAFHVLQSAESFFTRSGASCKTNAAAFSINITTTKDQMTTCIESEPKPTCKAACENNELVTSNSSNNQSDELRFRISVFRQMPGTFVVKGALQENACSISGLFLLGFQQLEYFLKKTFCPGSASSADGSFQHRR